MDISCVVAYDRNRVIGNGGAIPWRITGEQARFRELTTGGVVLMGRVTFLEIARKLGCPLPNRHTIVVSGSLAREAALWESPLCTVAPALDDALLAARSLLETRGVNELFVAGGAMLYEALLPRATRLYVTEIDAEFPGDRFFPPVPAADWTRAVEKTVTTAEYPYRYVTYTRNLRSAD